MEFTEQKHRDLASMGNLRVIRECQWKEMLRTMDKPVTQMGRILCQDNEESLLKAILDNDVYGFVVADVFNS